MPSFLLDIFCSVHDFCKHFENECAKNFLPSKGKRRRSSRLHLSEMMTILIYFHRRDYRRFKHYDLELVSKEWRSYFSHLVCYSRFVQLIPQALMALPVFLNGLKGKETNRYYVDSTTLKACHGKREKRHKFFKGLDKKAKSSMGWFSGLKLHMVINPLGEIMSFKVTSGATDDRAPVPGLLKNLQEWLFGDRGYLGQEFIEKIKKRNSSVYKGKKKHEKENIHEPTEFFSE
jgi:hypothetical protein